MYCEPGHFLESYILLGGGGARLVLLTLLTILRLNAVGRLICLFVGSAFQLGFLPSKLCFSLKPVQLNLCYTKVNHTELVLPVSPRRSVRSMEAGFSSIHRSTVEPESEFRPKCCKIAFKDAVKLIFLKRIFKFMINAAPPASNSIYDREKCFKYNNFTQLFSKWQRGLIG